jgi:hypothetical protein
MVTFSKSQAASLSDYHPPSYFRQAKDFMVDSTHCFLVPKKAPRAWVLDQVGEIGLASYYGKQIEGSPRLLQKHAT